jgi:hypothetical protein
MTAQTKTVELLSTGTDVHTIDLDLVNDATGASDPIPAGDTFTATSPSIALNVTTSPTGGTTGGPALVISAATLPSANTMGMTFPVTDSAGDVALTVIVNYPEPPVVNDITLGTDTVSTQPAPTTAGP